MSWVVERIGGRRLALAPILVALFAFPFLGTHYTSLMVVVAIHTMLTVGLCLLMGYTGQVSLGHAAFYGTGAFGSGILTATYHLSPWLAIIVAAVITGVIAFLVALPIFRLEGHYLAMATLGFGMIVFIFLNQTHGLTGGPSGLRGIPSLSIGGFSIDSDFRYYYLVWAFCLVTLLISRNIVHSRVGRALRSIHGSEPAAESLGVNVVSFKVKIFVLSAVYASVAGSLYAHYTTFISPQPFGFLFSVKLVVMVVIGGLANIWGAVFGTLVITFLAEFLHPFGNFDVIVYALILILVMIFMPDGLISGLRELIAERRFLVWRRGQTA